MTINRIKYWIIDVDGTMTDGGIYHDSNGNEVKKFNTRDAAGIFVCKKLGIKTVVITGRTSKATEKRMSEIKIDYLFQGIKDKLFFLEKFIDEHHIEKNQIGYIGDDLNDFQAMKLAGYVACPCDACFEIRQVADYISPIKGGEGVIRDVIEHSLRNHEGLWEKAISDVYGVGV